MSSDRKHELETYEFSVNKSFSTTNCFHDNLGWVHYGKTTIFVGEIAPERVTILHPRNRVEFTGNTKIFCTVKTYLKQLI